MWVTCCSKVFSSHHYLHFLFFMFTTVSHAFATETTVLMQVCIISHKSMAPIVFQKQKRISLNSLQRYTTVLTNIIHQTGQHLYHSLVKAALFPCKLFNGFLKAIGAYDSRVSAHPAVKQTAVPSECDKCIVLICF